MDEQCDPFRISPDLERHGRWLRDDFELAFSEIYFHDVVCHRPEFIENFPREVSSRVLGDGERQFG